MTGDASEYFWHIFWWFLSKIIGSLQRGLQTCLQLGLQTCLKTESEDHIFFSYSILNSYWNLFEYLCKHLMKNWETISGFIWPQKYWRHVLRCVWFSGDKSHVLKTCLKIIWPETWNEKILQHKKKSLKKFLQHFRQSKKFLILFYFCDTLYISNFLQ